MKKNIGFFTAATLLAVLAFPALGHAQSYSPDPCNTYNCLGGLLAQGHPVGASQCNIATSQFFAIWYAHNMSETASQRWAYINTCPGSGAVQKDISNIIAAFGTQRNPPPF